VSLSGAVARHLDAGSHLIPLRVLARHAVPADDVRRREVDLAILSLEAGAAPT
jgi:hypothetical protein